MIRGKRFSKSTFLKMEEAHALPLMLLAMLPVLLVLEDFLSGILIGLATVLAFLFLEGVMFWMEGCLGSGWRKAARLVMLAAVSGIMGIFLQLALFERTGAPLWLVVLEQAASIYIVKKLVSVRTGGGEFAQKEEAEKKEGTEEEEAEKKEDTEEEEAEKQGRVRVFFKELLICFEMAAEYMVFLVLLGFLRELLGRWTGIPGLLSGGFLLTAALLFLWKFTGTMPERFGKLPRYALSVGLAFLALAGFAGLL